MIIMQQSDRAPAAGELDERNEAARLYLDLLKKCVSNFIYDDDFDLMRAKHALDPVSGKYVRAEAAASEPHLKYYGAIWPSRAHTMIGIPRLDNLQFCVEEVIKERIAGDLIETGVWRGGASIFMRGILRAHGITDRCVWVADSFEGLPQADRIRYPKETKAELHRYDELAVSLDEVRANFERYGLLDDQVRFLKGWFKDTLPLAPIDRLAVLRLDGDMYESTMDALIHLYAKLSPGGFVIIDDYDALESCNAAVSDFRNAWRVAAPLQKIPGKGAFWKKEALSISSQRRTAAPTDQPRNAVIPAQLQKALSLHQRGELSAAQSLYREILKVAPSHFDALHLLGVVEHQSGRSETAIELIRRAIEVDPNQAAAHSNLGNALAALKRHQEALASYDQALMLSPGFSEALSNRGGTLLALRRYEEALSSFTRALALQPCNAEAHNGCGIALMQLKRREDALVSFDRALALKPDLIEVLNNRAALLVEIREYEAAADAFARLLSVAPDYKYALGHAFHSRLQCCDWNDYAAMADKLVAEVCAGKPADFPFAFLAVSQSARAQLKCARNYAANKYPVTSSPRWTGGRYQHRRIRVAYVSADFREHATSFLLAGLFERHDRQRFETIAIALRPHDNTKTGLRVRNAFEQFIDMSQNSDFEIAQRMRALEIDIAVDLMGFTQAARTAVFSQRPAPIQVNYLGFPGTLGADYIDYILADECVIPRAMQAHYAEKVVYLPDCFQANDDRRAMPADSAGRMQNGLPESAFVFCSFNRSYKLNPPMFDIWMRLLDRVPDSVLWLLADGASVERNLRAEAARRGVDPGRVIFAARLPYAAHLARLQSADLFLDSLPFNAGTTASDALWAGVPLLSCAGEAFASRMGASLLSAVGLPELITHSLEEYQALALRLASEPGLLAQIRTRLAAARATCPLFATERFRRHIESAYQTMWERHQRAEPPASFAVAAIS